MVAIVTLCLVSPIYAYYKTQPKATMWGSMMVNRVMGPNSL